ncbi:hypothetical protein Nans01_14240 [Nocardiopsis ansamitocini]|uniref:Uncharacterized protein n=1 Tax=Nocardiopsis ansamitocini TaxID=1670832 RepID=A0A9W6UI59_9ACTN|nr:hypothetical protein Nans01_14240 [Nocardiopsis ansamitocini]
MRRTVLRPPDWERRTQENGSLVTPKELNETAHEGRGAPSQYERGSIQCVAIGRMPVPGVTGYPYRLSERAGRPGPR